ncbi:hypothetical protein GCM10027280_26550 [Micromonospora polyrhachis]|uniref:Uncharacterized protein n=1 Tax=Micromonospora polyrhachis TaxID=1282883 RepID=A0A7W7SQ94_9ACTN|nr:hypothetical protein [Micromonospora polyrhachis]MBB4957750.1 hypothetical protein [Micromonospora polyrhachis]
MIRLCTWLADIAGTRLHAELIACCLKRLDLFRLSRQLQVLNRLLHSEWRHAGT